LTWIQGGILPVSAPGGLYPLSLWERVRVRGFVPGPPGPLPPALSRREKELGPPADYQRGALSMS
jgi:hypothetical protein